LGVIPPLRVFPPEKEGTDIGVDPTGALVTLLAEGRCIVRRGACQHPSGRLVARRPTATTP